MDSDDFTSICRTSDGENNQRCKSGDYVSDYAKSLPQEDYADHFMYWFMELPVTDM